MALEKPTPRTAGCGEAVTGPAGAFAEEVPDRRRDQHDDVEPGGQADGPVHPGQPGGQGQAEARDRGTVGDDQDADQHRAEGEPCVRRHRRGDEHRQHRQRWYAAEGAPPLAQDDRPGRQRGGQQHVEAAALALLGQARHGRDAKEQQPGGHLQAADHPARFSAARPGAAERIDDRPEAEPTREHAEEAPDGDRPARRPPPMPLAPEHRVAVE
jgi:hypothetical protein